MVLGAEWKQPLAGVLEVFLQEQVSRCGQEKVLAVGGADILRGSHRGGDVRRLQMHILNSSTEIITATLQQLCSFGAFFNHNIFLCAMHLGLDDKGPVSSDGDLLLHDAEAVEAADEHPSAVQPQGEVHVVAGEALLVVLDVLTAVHVEEEEVVEVAFGEGLPLLGSWK